MRNGQILKVAFPGSLIFWVVGMLTLCQAQAPYVPVAHRVYPFLERLETKHTLRGGLSTSRPLSRTEVANCLVRLLTSVESLNRVEKEQLEFFCFEFEEEIEKLGLQPSDYQSDLYRLKNNRCIKKFFPKFLYANDRNFYSWQRDQIQIYIDPIYRYQLQIIDTDSLAQQQQAFHFSNGLSAWGYLGKNLSFGFDFRDNKEGGGQSYPLGNYTLPGLGFVRATSPEFIYHDETQSYLKLGLNNFQLVFGKFDNVWASGASGNLILSDYATSYDQFKIEFLHNRFKLTSIYAFLIDYRFHVLDSLQERKYLVGHRLEIEPWHWLRLGFSETVLFKGRSFEPSYLNPLMFLRSAEHYLGSPDNMLMAFDFKCTLINKMKFYGELLLDDINSAKLGTDWYGNKFGWLAGIFFAEPFRLANLDLTLEYIRLRPYVYTHENSLSYTHYASTLGHWIGPNSDLLSLFLNYQPTRRLHIVANFQQLRHGQNSTGKNYGGDIERHWDLADNFYPKFLSGDQRRCQQIQLQFSYELLRNLLVELGFFREYQKYSPLDENGSRTNSTALFGAIGINY